MVRGESACVSRAVPRETGEDTGVGEGVLKVGWMSWEGIHWAQPSDVVWSLTLQPWHPRRCVVGAPMGCRGSWGLSWGLYGKKVRLDDALSETERSRGGGPISPGQEYGAPLHV